MSELEQKVVGATSSPGTEASLKHRAQELGLIGKIFGSKEHAPVNIAGFAVILSFVAVICIIIWMPESNSFSKKDAATALLGVITLALGFLFGRGSAGAD